MDIVRRFREAPLLEREEEKTLLRAWQESGDEKARDRLLLTHGRLAVKHAMRRARPDTALFGDLVQAGCRGILKAIDDFDLSFDVRLSTYAWRWIQTHMAHEAAVSVGVVNTPKAMRVKMVSGMRDSVPEEIRVLIQTPSSLDAPTADGTFLSEFLASDDEGPEDILDRIQRDELISGAVSRSFEVLTERERFVVSGRTLGDEVRTLADLGDELGVSRERVRQIEAVAFRKMKDHLSRSEKAAVAAVR